MNSIILCEGKTDAVLLGYYLDKLCGFAPSRQPINKELTLDTRQNNECYYWHTRGNDCLAIWGVGGKDCFESAIMRFS